MKIAECNLVSLSPYSQSRHYEVPKLTAQELPKDYEERTWRERCNVTADGHIFIPPMAFANAVKEGAKFLNRKVPGQRNATYTKHFEAGVLVPDALVLPEEKANVQGEWLFVPSNGQRGGGSRVDKCFPLIPKWQGTVTFYILDDLITPDIFEEVVKVAGNLVGIGRFRPRNLGYYGRFKLDGMVWVEE